MGGGGEGVGLGDGVNGDGGGDGAGEPVALVVVPPTFGTGTMMPGLVLPVEMTGSFSQNVP